MNATDPPPETLRIYSDGRSLPIASSLDPGTSVFTWAGVPYGSLYPDAARMVADRIRQLEAQLTECRDALGKLAAEVLGPEDIWSSPNTLVETAIKRLEEVRSPTGWLADRLSIEGDGTAKGTRVHLDGEFVRGVQGVTWETGIDRRTTVTLKLSGNPRLVVNASDAPHTTHQ